MLFGFRRFKRGEARCKVCGRSSPLISEYLGVCLACIREKPEEAVPIALEAHRKAREQYGFPPTPPKAEGGLKCTCLLYTSPSPRD